MENKLKVRIGILMCLVAAAVAGFGVLLYTGLLDARVEAGPGTAADETTVEPPLTDRQLGDKTVTAVLKSTELNKLEQAYFSDVYEVVTVIELGKAPGNKVEFISFDYSVTADGTVYKRGYADVSQYMDVEKFNEESKGTLVHSLVIDGALFSNKTVLTYEITWEENGVPGSYTLSFPLQKGKG